MIKSKAKEQLERLSFFSEPQMPPPLASVEPSETERSLEIKSENPDLSTATKMSVFSDDRKEGLQIAERRVLSIMSAKERSSTSKRENEEEEDPVVRLRNLPKVVDGQFVWETLSKADKSSLFLK